MKISRHYTKFLLKSFQELFRAFEAFESFMKLCVVSFADVYFIISQYLSTKIYACLSFRISQDSEKQTW
jgi:hypothetical protein